jgi:hypothetical protein
MYINITLFQIIWFIPNLYEFIQICFEFIWKYAHCRTAGLPDYRTLPHHWTAPHCREHSRTAAHCRTLPRTLPHCRTQPCALPQTAAHCMNLNAAHRILRTAHSRTPQLTWIEIIICENNWHECNAFTWMYVNLCESIRIHMNQNNFIWM